MASRSITIFSNKLDPDAVPGIVQRFDPKAEIDRDGTTWSQIKARFPRGFLRKPLILTLHHDPSYYQGPDWPKQQMGMLGYFARFPIEGERRQQLVSVVQSFQFSLGSVVEPDFLAEEPDPRLELLCAIARHLDGCLFAPTGLLDASARVLISGDGSFDPTAAFPDVPAEFLPPDDDEEDEDEEQEPPDADRVARRALVLAAVAGRGLLEAHSREGHADGAAQLPYIGQWLQDLDLRSECEPEEWERITTPVGELDDQAMVDSTWRFEGLGVLCWALGLFDLPRYDTMIDVDELMAATGFLDPARGRAVLEKPRLRPGEELNEKANQILAFHWRMRDFSLRPVAMDFLEFGETCWFGPISTDWAETVERDLALDGLPISMASEDTIGRCTSIAMERHVAINWLRGFSRIYSETDTST